LIKIKLGQTEVCAATASSFANQAMWYIYLQGSAMKFAGKPVFVISKSAESAIKKR